MPKYLILKHYRGTPATVNDVPMDRWTPDEVDAHMQFMDDFGKRLEADGEFVDAQALSPEGAFVRADDQGKEPITDGPFAETKDLIAGLVRHRRRRLGPRRRAGRGAVARPGCGRQADPRVARGAPVLRLADRHRGLTRSDGSRSTARRCARSSRR